MPSNVTMVRSDGPGSGYKREDGRSTNVEALRWLLLSTLAAGQTISSVLECGDRAILRLTEEITAKGGTSPTLTCEVETSPDGLTAWRSIGSFAQKSDVGLALSAVSSTGTTPPAVTFTGTPNRYIDFRMECTTLGARGVAVVRYSIDGGKSWIYGQVTAATWALLDANGVDTGVVVNYANATAAVDNVWTASTQGFERKTFSGLDRYARLVFFVGGSAGPTMTTSISGELV